MANRDERKFMPYTQTFVDPVTGMPSTDIYVVATTLTGSPKIDTEDVPIYVGYDSDSGQQEENNRSIKSCDSNGRIIFYGTGVFNLTLWKRESGGVTPDTEKDEQLTENAPWTVNLDEPEPWYTGTRAEDDHFLHTDLSSGKFAEKVIDHSSNSNMYLEIPEGYPVVRIHGEQTSPNREKFFSEIVMRTEFDGDNPSGSAGYVDPDDGQLLILVFGNGTDDCAFRLHSWGEEKATSGQQMVLAGGQHWTAAAGDCITLIYSNGKWREVSRAAGQKASTDGDVGETTLASLTASYQSLVLPRAGGGVYKLHPENQNLDSIRTYESAFHGAPTGYTYGDSTLGTVRGTVVTLIGSSSDGPTLRDASVGEGNLQLASDTVKMGLYDTITLVATTLLNSTNEAWVEIGRAQAVVSEAGGLLELTVDNQCLSDRGDEGRTYAGSNSYYVQRRDANDLQGTSVVYDLEFDTIDVVNHSSGDVINIVCRRPEGAAVTKEWALVRVRFKDQSVCTDHVANALFDNDGVDNHVSGEMHLQLSNDFWMVPDESLQLMLVEDEDGVQYWVEVGRYERGDCIPYIHFIDSYTTGDWPETGSGNDFWQESAADSTRRTVGIWRKHHIMEIHHDESSDIHYFSRIATDYIRGVGTTVTLLVTNTTATNDSWVQFDAAHTDVSDGNIMGHNGVVTVLPTNFNNANEYHRGAITFQCLGTNERSGTGLQWADGSGSNTEGTPNVWVVTRMSA